MNAVLRTAVAAASGDDSPSVLLPAWPDLIWGTVCFVIIAVVVIKVAVPRFTVVLDKRAATIQEGLDLAASAKADKAGAEATARREIDEARLEAARIREQAHSDAQAIIVQAREAAQAEAGKAMAAAERQIEAERQAAQISLRTDVGILATSLAERIIGEQLTDTELSGRVIDRFLDQLDADNATSQAGAGRRVR